MNAWHFLGGLAVVWLSMIPLPYLCEVFRIWASDNVSRYRHRKCAARDARSLEQLATETALEVKRIREAGKSLKS